VQNCRFFSGIFLSKEAPLFSLSMIRSQALRYDLWAFISLGVGGLPNLNRGKESGEETFKIQEYNSCTHLPV
jgi:hypothetical protein